MAVVTQKRMTLEEYLSYNDAADARYELVDGVLVEMGAENPLNANIAVFLLVYFVRQIGVPYSRLAIGHQIGVDSSKATARQPDLIVHSPESSVAILEDGKLLRPNMPAPLLVVEVVSNSKTDPKSRDRDYSEKAEEYAKRGISEYWIVDPDEALIKVGVLASGSYNFVAIRGRQTISSPTFPQLGLTVDEVLTAGAGQIN